MVDEKLGVWKFREGTYIVAIRILFALSIVNTALIIYLIVRGR